MMNLTSSAESFRNLAQCPARALTPHVAGLVFAGRTFGGGVAQLNVEDGRRHEQSHWLLGCVEFETASGQAAWELVDWQDVSVDRTPRRAMRPVNEACSGVIELRGLALVTPPAWSVQDDVSGVWFSIQAFDIARGKQSPKLASRALEDGPLSVCRELVTSSTPQAQA